MYAHLHYIRAVICAPKIVGVSQTGMHGSQQIGADFINYTSIKSEVFLRSKCITCTWRELPRRSAARASLSL